MTFETSQEDLIDKFKEKIFLENPFSIHPSPQTREIMIGADRWLKEFAEIFRFATSESVISFIIGRPGSGKSQFINHLDYQFNRSDNGLKGFYTCYFPPDELFGTRNLCTSIVTEDNRKKLKGVLDSCSEEKLAALNVSEEIYLQLNRFIKGNIDFEKDQSTGYTTIKKLFSTIIRLLKYYYGEPAGICVAIDNIDEFLRNQQAKGKTWDDATVNLFSTLRFFLDITKAEPRDESKGILVLLATTIDAYNKIYDAIRSDATLFRRTILSRVEEPQLVFDTLSESQCYELVNAYLSVWARKNKIFLPKSQQCVVSCNGGREANIFPFSPLVIKHFYEASGGVPGAILAGCSYAINTLQHRKELFIFRSIHAKDIVERVYAHWPDFFPRQTIVSTELDPEILRERNEQIFSEIEHQIRNQYRFKEPEKEEIKKSINSFAELIDITQEPAELVPNYRKPQNYVKVDNIWNLNDKRIAVSFILENEIRLNDLITMVSTLKTNYLQVSHGLFICCLNAKPIFERGSGTFTSTYILQADGYKLVLLPLKIETPIFWRILALTLLINDENKQKELAIHLDKYGARGKSINLINQLTELTKKDLPPPRERERHRFEDMTG